jgi:hypothetical protein
MSDTLLGTSANAAGADKLSFTAATALKSITLGGTADASVDLHNVGATVTTLNASGLSGTEQDGSAASLTLVDTGSSALSAGLTITGSALGKDSIDLHADTITGAGVVTITGGGGASSFTLNPAELDSTQPAYFKLVGGAGANTLFVENVATGAVTLADTAFASVSGIAKLDLNGTNDTGAISLAGGGYFSAAFANGVSISAGAAQTGDVATIINIGGAVPDKVTLTDTSTAVTAADVITLGGGADTATVTANATITTGSVTDNMGNGANTVTITEGNANSSGGFTAVFNTGTGVDAMTSGVIGSTAAHSEVNFSFGSNGLITSGSTVSTLDTITGYYVSAGSGRFSDTLTFVSAAANGAIASTAVSSFTTAQEAFSVSANGILTFTGTSTIGQTAAQLDALALGAYHSTIAALMTAHGTIAYSDGANTLVFNHHSSGVDSVVELIGVTGITQLGTAAATSHLVGIA